MAKSRKDNKGRVLLKGESYREAEKRYQYTYIDCSGKKRYIYSKDIMRLRVKEAEVQKDKTDEIDSHSAKKVTLNEMFNKHLQMSPNLSDSTLANYWYNYNAYLVDGIGKRRIKDIKYSDMLAFYLLLAQKHHLCLNTIKNIHMLINSAFKLALRDGIIRINPLDGVIEQLKNQIGAKTKKKRSLTREQQTLFMNYLDTRKVYRKWKPIFQFLLGTGLRIGELSGLCWSNIDFENGYIIVDHQLKYNPKRKKEGKTEYVYNISSPKSEAGIRIIPMIKDVRNILLELQYNRQQHKELSEIEIDGYSDFVFLNTQGNLLNRNSVQKAVKRIIKAYNRTVDMNNKDNSDKKEYLPYFTPHSFRHTFCTRLCENGVNIKVIQTIMGHSDIKVTMNIYAEVSSEITRDSLLKIEDNLII